MKHFTLLFTVFALSLAACQTRTEEPIDDMTADSVGMPETGLMATASLSPTEGSSVSGQVTFMQEASGIRVQGSFSGLTPGDHGFHVHQNGDCSAADLADDPDSDPNPAGAAGPHWAPQDSPHGAPGNDAASRHVGDMGNITAGEDGTAMIDVTDAVLALEGPNSIVGKAVIVHADADDLTSQPSGNAGARLACGVVQMGGMDMSDGNMGGAGMTGTMPDTSTGM